MAGPDLLIMIGIDEVLALVRGRQAFREIRSQGYVGLDFKSVGLIDRTLQAVTQAQSQGQIGADLPCVLDIAVVGLGFEVADRGLAGRQQRAILPEGEVGGVLREPSDDGGGRILHFREGIQALIGPSSGQTLRDQILLEGIGDILPRPQIKRWVGDGVVKGIGEADPAVADHPDIGAELDIVVSPDPGNIIGEVVHRRDPAESVLLAGGLKHETEADVVPVAVAALVERLPGVAIAEIVDPVVAQGPGMAGGHTPGMVPDQGRLACREASWPGSDDHRSHSPGGTQPGCC